MSPISYANPIWHRHYRIYPSDAPFREMAWAFVHDDYDGAPDSNDNRYGFGGSVAECVLEIEERFPLNIPPPATATELSRYAKDEFALIWNGYIALMEV